MGDIYSTGADTADVATTCEAWWLKVPEEPALNMSVRWQPGSIKVRRPEQQGRFRAFGRSAPVVTRGTLGTVELSLQLVLIGEAEIEAFEAVRAAQLTVLLQDPRGRQWYLAIGDTVDSEERFDSDRRTSPVWRVTANAVEVDVP